MTAPTLSGSTASGSVTEASTAPNSGETARVAFLSGVSIVDQDASTPGEITGAVVRISSNFQTGATHQDFLRINGTMSGTIAGSDIAYSYDNATGIMTLTGGATPAEYKAAIELVRFSTSGDNITAYGSATTRQIAVSVSDGADSSTETVVSVAVTGINDAPINSGSPPTGAAFVEDASNLALTGFSVSDVDANPATQAITVTLMVTHGSLDIRTDVVGGISAAMITSGADNSGSITVTATQNQINATLAAANGLTYTPPANFNGNPSFAIVTNDRGLNGNDPGLTGTGTTEQDADGWLVNIAAVNDPVTGTAPATAGVSEDASNAAIAGLSISDVDATLAPAGVYEVTLSSTHGTLTLTTLTGLTFSGASDGTADTTMTFHGTLAAINAALATARYTPTANYNGSAQITLQVTDTFGTIVATGSGSATSDSDTINVTVNSVNDAPAGGDSSAAVADGATHLFSAADFNFTDAIEGNAFAGVVITTLPSSGALYFDTDGAGGASPVAVTAGQFISAANIAAGQLSYQAAGEGSPTFTFQVRDDGGTANGGQDTDQSPNTFTLNVAPDTAPVLDLNTGAGGINDINAYSEAGTPAAIGTAIAVLDADAGDNIESATVTITDPETGDELVVGALPAGITIDGSSTATTLILIGSASPSAYATALGQVRYANSGDHPTDFGANTDRSITVVVNDGSLDSIAATATIAVTDTDEPPLVPDSPAISTDEQAVVTINAALSVSDADLDARNGGNGDYAGATFTISRSMSNPDDVFSFASGGGFTVIGANLEAGGQVFGTIAQSGGLLTVSFTSSETVATTALVNDVLQHLQYTNTSDDPPASVELTYALNDGAPGGGQGPVEGGSNTDSGHVTITINPVGDQPAVAQDDAFTNDGWHVLNGNLFADNGSGADSDPDGPSLAIAEVNGNAADVEVRTMLASGAHLTVNGNGTFTYEPNVSTQVPPGSDSFTYTLVGGDTATVSLTIENGEAIIGNGGNNRLVGDGGDNAIYGLGGADYLTGGFGNDLIAGGDGAYDRAGWYQTNPDFGGATVDLRLQGQAQDTGSQGFDTMVGIENLSGTPFADTLTGDDNDNWLWGSGAYLFGEVISTTNDDRLDGQGGNDLLTVGAGDHTLIGGDGSDTVRYTENGGPETRIILDLNAQGGAQDSGAGSWTLSGIENLASGDGDDALGGDGNDNVLAGGAGSDWLVGAGGNDRLYGDGTIATNSPSTGPITEFPEDSRSVNAVPDGNDVLEGGDGDDILYGGGGNDLMWGGSGSNTLLGGAGDDYLGSQWGATDIIDGGDGTDVLNFNAGYSPGPVYFDFDTSQFDGTSWVNVESVRYDGTADSDDVIGSSNADYITGEDGDDVLRGGDGNDTLIGNWGDDTIAGGGGDDLLYGSFEFGPAFFDLNGPGFFFFFDTLDYTDSAAGVTVQFRGAFDSVATGADTGTDSFFSFEGVLGSSGGDTVMWDATTRESFSNEFSFDGRLGIDQFEASELVYATLSGAGDGTAELSSDNPSAGLNEYRNVSLVSVEIVSLTAASGYSHFAITGSFDPGVSIVATGSSQGLYLDGTNLTSSTSITFNGGSGSDTFSSGVSGANDYFDGGDGFDWIDYYASTAGVTVNLAEGFATGAEIGTDTLQNVEGIIGSQGNDLLVGDAGDNAIDGWEGDDAIEGGDGNDSLNGEEGNDVLTGGAGNDANYGGSGDDLIRGRAGDDLIDGGEGYDRAGYYHTDEVAGGVTVDLNITGPQNTGSQGWDTLVSIEYLSGTPFADVLIGDGNDNILWGSIATIDPETNYVSTTNNDLLDGGGGNDLLVVGIGNHTLIGGSGVDTVAFTENFGDDPPIVIDLNFQDGAQNTGQGFWTLTGIENLSGGDDNDVLTGDDYANLLAGAFGDDLLNGGGGNDTLYGDGAMDSGAPSSGPPTLFADVGGNGNDTLDGGAGDDVLYGGGGTDTASFASESGGVQAFLYNGGFGEALAADGYDQLHDIENLTGSNFNDQLFGNNLENVLSGGDGIDLLRGRAGNDTLQGGDGDDYLDGGVGDDVLDGGDGWDRLSYFGSATGPVTVDLRIQGVAQATGQGNDTLIDIEHVGGTSYGDTLTGNDGDNVIRGQSDGLGSPVDHIGGQGGNDLISDGAGDHVLDGGAGTDTYLYEWLAVQSGINVSLALQGAAQNTGVGNLTLSNFENVTGTIYTDNLTGDSNANVLAGDLGDDILSGGAGNDSLYGDGMFFMDDQGTGLSGPIGFMADSTSFYVGGVAGNDTLEGGLGNDLVSGGGGSDTASYEHALGAVTVTLFNNTTGNGNSSGADGNDTLNGIENITGSAYDDTLNGSAVANIIVGGGGNDVLRGFGGNDTLYGGYGNDFLAGGVGDDYLDGGAGIDRAGFSQGASAGVTVDLRVQGSAQDTGLGIDTLVGIENLSGTVFSDTLIGNDGDNYLWGVTDAATAAGDIIDGQGGNDLIEIGAGSHTVTGGSGIDTLLYNPFNDGSTGATISLALQGASQNTGVGTMTLGGFENLSGGDFNDTLTGDGGANVLAGGLGDDILVGGAGNDSVYGDGFAGIDSNGGSGPITFFDDVGVTFGLADGNDMLEGALGDDLLNGGGGVDTATYAHASGSVAVDLGSGAAGGADGNDTLTSIENVTGSQFADDITGDGGANVLEGLSGNDFIAGGAGNDTITGGDGDDFLQGDFGDNNLSVIGNDTIYGGNGNDGLRGGAGNDFLYGGAGNDLMRGNSGVDYFDGGADDGEGFNGIGDRVGFYEQRATQGVVADLRTGIISNDGYGNVETMVGIESLGAGTAFVDTFYGNDGRNFLFGDRGDYVYGFGGDDIFQLASATAILDGGAGTDRLALLTSGQWLMPDANTDGLAELAAAASAGWTVNLAAGALIDGYGNSGTVAGIENVDGSTLGDTLIGDSNVNVLNGFDGNDTLNGRGGNDTLDGGIGNDTASYANASGGVTVDLAAGTSSGADGSDSLANIENVIGSAFNDGIFGDGGNNLISGGDGDDRILGGAGNDNLLAGNGNDILKGQAGDDVIDGGAGIDRAGYYQSDSALGGVTVSLLFQGVAQNTGSQGWDTLIGIEHVFGTPFADVLTGDNSANWLSGSEATLSVGNVSATNNDRLDGQGGNDLLSVGIGNHTIIGGAGTDTLWFTENGFPETGITISLALQGAAQATGNGNWTLTGIENLSGGSANDGLTGDGLVNVLGGGAGNDTLIGGGGNDTLYGDGVIGVDGSGVITTYVDVATISLIGIGTDVAVMPGASGNDTLEGGLGNDTLNGGGGTDTASYANASGIVTVNLTAGTATGADGTDALISIENVIGSASADTITGDTNANVLDGRNGNDTLNGRSGNDTLIGGGGIDTATYANATGGVTVNLTLGTASGADGADTLATIENVTGSSFADTITGEAGANVLNGGDGDDTLNGRLGNDTLNGGNGIDTASYANATGAVSVNLSTGSASGADGSDTLTLVENVTGSSFADTLRGDDLANLLNGGAGIDTLLGGKGDDSLYGGSGNDVMTGSQGNDRFVMEGSSGSDTVVDFVMGSDKIVFDASSGVTSFSQLTITKVGSDARVSWAGGNSVLLQGVRPTSLTASDFQFGSSASFAAAQFTSMASDGILSGAIAGAGLAVIASAEPAFASSKVDSSAAPGIATDQGLALETSGTGTFSASGKTSASQSQPTGSSHDVQTGLRDGALGSSGADFHAAATSTAVQQPADLVQSTVPVVHGPAANFAGMTAMGVAMPSAEQLSVAAEPQVGADQSNAIVARALADALGGGSHAGSAIDALLDALPEHSGRPSGLDALAEMGTGNAADTGHFAMTHFAALQMVEQVMIHHDAVVVHS